MIKAATKAILSAFEDELTRRIPDLQRIKDEPVPNGCRLFGCRAEPSLSMYIMVGVVRGERFYVEVAWTRHGKWPGNTFPLSPRDVPELGIRQDPPKDGNFRFRLPLLWRRDDQSWEVVPELSTEEIVRMCNAGEYLPYLAQERPVQEVLPKIKELARDAVDKIELYAVPYFTNVARSVGAEWSAGASGGKY